MQRIQNGATAGNVVADEYIADISSENALGTMDHDGPCSQLDVEDNVGTNMMNSDDDDSDDDDSDDDDSDVDDSVDDYDEFAPFCPIDPPHQEHSPNGGEGADSAAQTLVQPLAREELEAGEDSALEAGEDSALEAREDSANNFFAALSASTTQTAVAVPEPPAAGATSNLALATFTSTAPASVNPVPVASASVVPPSDIAASIASSTDARVTLLQTNTNAFNCPAADAIAKTPNPDLTTNLSSGLLLGPTETHHAQNTKRQSPLSRTAARQRKKQELLSRVPFGGDVSHLVRLPGLCVAPCDHDE